MFRLLGEQTIISGNNAATERMGLIYHLIPQNAVRKMRDEPVARYDFADNIISCLASSMNYDFARVNDFLVKNDNIDVLTLYERSSLYKATQRMSQDKLAPLMNSFPRVTFTQF